MTRLPKSLNAMSVVGGIFYYGDLAANKEMESRLDSQGKPRTFMSKDGILPFLAAKMAT
jgi:hypothetical protein